jgi:hypothetical protein
MDLVGSQPVVGAGIYWLSPVVEGSVAKMGSVMVQLVEINKGTGSG